MPFINTSKPLIKIIILCSVLLSLTAMTDKRQYDKKYNVKLQIINNQSNRISNFMVKIAKTDDEKEVGLMWIKYLPENYGMLFEFGHQEIVNMWMKNTKIPLDMLFINQEHKIINIKHRAQPESLEIISSTSLVTKVLEINGGLVEKLGIKIGDKISYTQATSSL